MVSDSTLQLPFKPLLLVMFGCNIKNNSPNHMEGIKLLLPFSITDLYLYGRYNILTTEVLNDSPQRACIKSYVKQI